MDDADFSTVGNEFVNDVLAHYGVKGMRWGVRKDRPEGVTAKTSRDAKKDAIEFTKAKMYYGEGAGTRRKLIKATVESKTKANPSYKKAFDYHVERTDMSKRADQARSKRKVEDVKSGTAKTFRGISHYLRGNTQYASAAAATIAASAMYMHRTGMDQKIFNTGKAAFNTVFDEAKKRMGG